MDDSTFHPEFRWVRATRYRCREGTDGTPTHIEPHPEAKLKVYDPISKWVHHWSGKKRKDSSPPYLAVINEGIKSTEKGEGIGGLSEYGLLGILPQHLRRVVLWPRWEREGEGRWEIRQRGVMAWGPGAGRFDQRVAQEPGGQQLDPTPKTAGQPLSVREFEECWQRSDRGKLRHPGIEAYDPERLRVVPATLVCGYAPFFPGIDSTDYENSSREQQRRDYPLPDLSTEELDLTSSFWKQYAEPVVELRETIRRMERDLWVLHTGAERSSGRSEGKRRIQHILGSLTWNVSPAGKLQSVRIPSLLGALYWMMVRDRETAGRRVDECAMCGRYFATDRQDQKSCSHKCTSRLTTKRYRERKKERSESGP